MVAKVSRHDDLERARAGLMKIMVIGAGLGGMTAAGRLAAQGHDVTVIEASSRAGGKCVRETINGYTFDTGPSLLTLPATYRDFFLATGSALDLPLQPLEPAFTYYFSDGSALEVPNGPSRRVADAITTQWGSGGDQWRALMSRAEAMWDASRTPFVESGMPSLLTLMRSPHALRDTKTIAPWQSLRALGTKYLSDWRLRQLLDRYATYTGSDPRRAPAVLATIAFVEQNFGAWHIPGGVSRIAEAVFDRTRDLGVNYRFNTTVERIDYNGKRVTGLHIEGGERVPCDIVVANADASLVYNSLLEPAPITRAARRRIRRSEPSLAGFVILLGLKGTSHLGHHTVFFPEKYDDEFDSIFGRSAYQLPMDPAIYICSPDDPLMRPSDDSESWFVLVNAPRHGETFDWSKVNQEQYAHHIIDLIEKRSGIDVRSRIEVMEIRTPLDLQQRAKAPGGSIYGSSSNGARSAFLRADNRSPVQGLYCVGGSTHPGGGLPLVAISGELAARAIEADFD